MKLTKRELKAVYRAAEDIETGREWYCCDALGGGLVFYDRPELVEAFHLFYRKRASVWWGHEEGHPNPKHARAEKVLALLFFAEVCK